MRQNITRLLVLAGLVSAPTQALAYKTLTGTYIKAAYSENGLWNEDTLGTGLQVLNGSWLDVTYPGTPWNRITWEYNYGGSAYSYGATSDNAPSFTVLSEADISSGSTRAVQYAYQGGPLQITQVHQFDASGRYIVISFEVTNTGSSPVTNFRMIHAIDPDQDVYAGGSFETYNDTQDLSGDGVPDWVEAVGTNTGTTVGYGSCGGAADFGTNSGWSEDADLTLTDYNGASGDYAIYFRYGATSSITVPAGDSISFQTIFSTGTTTTAARSGYLAAVAAGACDSCDADGDGYFSATCGGSDCDDGDASVYPGADEYCDSVDNNCDGTIDEDSAVDASLWYRDADSDGYGNPSLTDLACNPATGYVGNATDCNDSASGVYPGAPEYCNGYDDDCDSTIDEDSAVDVATWYRDADSDGFGNPLSSDIDCAQPAGYVSDATDCDDGRSATYPGAPEYCNGIDDDCDSAIDEDSAVDAVTWYRDADADGFGDPASTDVECSVPAGYVSTATDCNDTLSSVYPGADEYCNGIDDDCDSAIDEDSAVDAVRWYRDADSDGFGDVSVSDVECSAPAGYVADSTDCDDATSAVRPGADEYCNLIDDDCDGTIDEGSAVDATTWYRDADGDGFGDPADLRSECYEELGYVGNSNDCDDTDPDTWPGAEEVPYDGIDQDCSGSDLCDSDGDTFDANECGGDDCDDEDETVFPGATETWYDGIDQDCDEASDFDVDGDGYDSESYGGVDCDDADPDTWPGAPDTPYDGIINDCDDADEYDADGDGHASSDYGGDDCDDANSEIYPGADETWYDGLDQDCDDADDNDQDGDGYSVDEDCDDTDPNSYPSNGAMDENCDTIEPELDTGGLTEAELGAATGGGGIKGCTTTKTASVWAGLVMLFAGGLRRRRRED